MVIKIENGIIKLMIKRGTLISPNSRFTIPYWTQTRKRAEVNERVIIYNGKGKFDFSKNSRGITVAGSFTTYYYNTSNPDYDVVELPINVKENGYISVHKLSGGIVAPLESGYGILAQKFYLTNDGLIPWDADAREIPMPEIINKRHRGNSAPSVKEEVCETASESVKNGCVIRKQLKFAEEDYSPKEQEFAHYLESVRAFKRTDVNFSRNVIHFVLQKNPDEELLQYLDADVFLSRELEGYLKLRAESRSRYRRCFKYWGEFCSGRKSRFAENEEIMTKYAEFVKYQQEKHYSMDTILKTCQIVDKIKTKNEFEDKDILKTDSDKLCETITGRRYTQCSDRFLNNVIRKYQAYLQECEA